LVIFLWNFLALADNIKVTLHSCYRNLQNHAHKYTVVKISQLYNIGAQTVEVSGREFEEI